MHGWYLVAALYLLGYPVAAAWFAAACWLVHSGKGALEIFEQYTFEKKLKKKLSNRTTVGAGGVCDSTSRL